MALQELYEFARSTWVVWMTLLFIGIVAWAYLPGNKKRFEDDGDIIFKDDKNGA